MPEPRGAAAALTVVIPALDESGTLPRLLDDLGRQTLAHRVIVVDGGSRDATVALARQAGAEVLPAPRGRGAQMNAGAAAARTPYLLFLHADSRLPDDRWFLEAAVAALRAACRAAGDDRVAGHFGLRFARGDGAAPHDRLYRFMEAKTRSNRDGTVNGDQGLLLTRRYLRELGGFDTRLPFFEDRRIAQDIFRSGRWILLPGVLATSARRFEAQGHRRRYALMGLMVLMHEAGLERFFDDARALYAAQDAARPLDLRPFLGLAGRLWAAELRRDPGRLLRAGGWLRSQAWQLGLMLDLAADGDSGVWTSRLARLLGSPRDMPPLDLGVTAAATAALLGAAAIWD